MIAALPAAVHVDAWHDFFIVVGTAAGALTGLQFVVMALNQGFRNPAVVPVLRSYSTPTVVYFTSVLALSAVLSFPNLTRAQLGAILLIVGAASIVYALFIFRNDRKQELYTADLEDTIWHFTLPPIAHLSILIAGLSAWSSPTRSLYMVAASMLALLIVGIHNAWDSAVWVLFRRPQDDE